MGQMADYLVARQMGFDSLEEMDELLGGSPPPPRRRGRRRRREADDDSDDDDDVGSRSEDDDQGPSSGRKKKQHKKRLSTRGVCATDARAMGATDRDLAGLDCKLELNPHNPAGYPMRLYLLCKVKALAERKKREKREEEEYRAEHAEEIAAAKAAAAREKRAAASAAAAAVVQRFKAGGRAKAAASERHGMLVLPDMLLATIMGHLAASVDPEHMQGPSAVAADLAAVSLACVDFYHASKHGMAALAGQLQAQLASRPAAAAGGSVAGLPALPGARGWSFWDQVVQSPMALKVPDLKEAARSLGLMVSGTKAELAVRLLAAFGLSTPTTAPAAVLCGVRLEHLAPSGGLRAGLCDGSVKCLDLMQRYVRVLLSEAQPGSAAAADLHRAQAGCCCGMDGGLAAARASLLRAGYSSMQQLVAAGQAAEAREAARRAQQRREAYNRMMQWHERALEAHERRWDDMF